MPVSLLNLSVKPVFSSSHIKLLNIDKETSKLLLSFSLGGRQGKMPVTALEAFDLETKSWTRYPCIPTRRAFSCCATNEQSLFSIGGLQQPGPHNFYSRPHFVSTMEEYDLDQGMSYFLVYMKFVWT